MLYFPWERNEKPFGVNEKGYEWYHDAAVNEYLVKKGIDNNVAGCIIRNVETQHITRVIFNKETEEIIFESQQYEAILVHIDVIAFLKNEK